MEIIPGILATSESEYKDLVEALNTSKTLAGGWVQLDLMDGKFVDNKSVDLEVVASYPLNFKVEAQLMVRYPENWIDELIEFKVSRIVFPVEDMAGVKERLLHIKNHGILVGLSINPDTEISVLDEYGDRIDEILVMGVHPGFGGQEMIQGTTQRVRQIRERHKDVTIEVDGGVNSSNVAALKEAGANAVVVGASRLVEGGIDETLEEIWQAVSKKSIN